MKNQIFLLCLAALIASCSVQKRRYQNGFYVSWHRKSPEKTLRPAQLKPRAEKREVNVSCDANRNNLTVSAATNERKLFPSPSAALPVAAKQTTTECDVVHLRRGDVVQARVTEINQEHIKYRRCDMSDGPVYTVKKSEVAKILYANGAEEVFHSSESVTIESAPDTKQPEKKRRKLNGLAMSALLIPLFIVIAFFSPEAIFISLGLLLALSIALGAISVDQISRNDRTFGGGFAIAGMAISFLILLVLLLAVALL